MDLVSRGIGKRMCTCLFVVQEGSRLFLFRKRLQIVEGTTLGLLYKTLPAHSLGCVIGNNEICIHCFFRKSLSKGRNTFLRRGQGRGVFQCLKNHWTWNIAWGSRAWGNVSRMYRLARWSTWANCRAWKKPRTGVESLPGVLNRCHLRPTSLSTVLRQRRLPPSCGPHICTWHLGSSKAGRPIGRMWPLGSGSLGLTVSTAYEHSLKTDKSLVLSWATSQQPCCWLQSWWVSPVRGIGKQNCSMGLQSPSFLAQISHETDKEIPNLCLRR